LRRTEILFNFRDLRADLATDRLVLLVQLLFFFEAAGLEQLDGDAGVGN
jgi:hypothetical protein